MRSCCRETRKRERVRPAGAIDIFYKDEEWAKLRRLMSSVLRVLDHTSLVAEHTNLASYKTRCESRPAFQRALAAQLADFEERDVG